MAPEGRKLDVVFLPYFTTSHLTPLVEMARLFASRGVTATIITTPCNAAIFQASIDRDVASGHRISTHTLKFPASELGIPEGIENFGAATSMGMAGKVHQGIALLQQPMEQSIRDRRPDCIVSDMFYDWTVNLADELKIPRLLFYPNCFFYHCVWHSLKLHAPHETVQSESESFVIPGLPNMIEMTRSQLPDYAKTKTGFGEVIDAIKRSELQSHGVVFDTFYEIEPAYADHFRKVIKRTAWHIGPLSHFPNRDKAETKNITTTEGDNNVRSWLDTQRPKSVLYVCFGSMVRFHDAQLTETVLALEASGHPFVSVVRKQKKRKENEQESWLPEGFEERMMRGNKGMIIRGWAPQVLILNHPATGGYMTHCGWNSVKESIIAGVPLITWPLFAEQFFNEKFITRVLKIGVRVGSEVWNITFEITDHTVGKAKIEEAVNFLMGGSEEAELIRRRVEELRGMANNAVEEGGSSYNDLTALIEEIKTCTLQK